jgi:drug/metabolite transporter (DMT)-like permease
MWWLPVALCAPILWAISTHIDKFLVERYFKERNVAVLMVFTALLGLLLIPWIALFAPVFRLPLGSIGTIVLAGLLYMVAMVFYLGALQSEEASVVAPFFQAAPIFAYALAYFVLHDTPSPHQLWGGGLVIAGSAILSLDPEHFGRPKIRLITLMLACALALAISSVIFKLFAIHDEFWTTTFWTYAGEALFGAGVLAIPSLRGEFMMLLRRSTRALLAINGANEVINLGGGLISRYALLLAPLGLVQAISSTTTIFVFLFGLLLSRFFPALGRENLAPKTLLQNGTGIIIVAFGITLVNVR